MSTIQVLDDHTINQIAAGEVVENAASVVKELVENSRDAGAKSITVEIKGGGRQLIRVVDDGLGMSPEDAQLCLQRHATSKLSQLSDLNNISSMGFRGEALPSIASVSKFTLLTKTATSPVTLIEVEGGTQTVKKEGEREVGTTIEVRSLFFNVPARRKFQRSPQSDANEVQKTLQLLALANPHISFRLLHNGKTLLTTEKKAFESWKEGFGYRVMEVMGAEFLAGTCPVEWKSEGVSIKGFLGMPQHTRHNRTGQTLILNGRPVFSPGLSQAVKEGYGTRIGERRFPVFILFLDLPGIDVDVNVHPQKRTIRLRHELRLQDLLRQAVEQALRSSRSQNSSSPTPLRVAERPQAPVYSVRPSSPGPSFSPRTFKPDSRDVFSLPASPFPLKHLDPLPRLLGRWKGWLMVEGSSIKEGWEDSIVFVDARRAHMRCLYEQIGRNLPSAPAQNLLLPLPLSLCSEEAILLEEHRESLSKLGFCIENHQGSLKLTTLPSYIKEKEAQEVIKDLLRGVRDLPDPRAELARRSALRRSHNMSTYEAEQLLKQWMKCREREYCPFGEPIVFSLMERELQKGLKEQHGSHCAHQEMSEPS